MARHSQQLQGRSQEKLFNYEPEHENTGHNNNILNSKGPLIHYIVSTDTCTIDLNGKQTRWIVAQVEFPANTVVTAT